MTARRRALTVGQLRELLAGFPDDRDVTVRVTVDDRPQVARQHPAPVADGTVWGVSEVAAASAGTPQLCIHAEERR